MNKINLAEIIPNTGTHGAALDFLVKLKQDLIKAVDENDMAEAQIILNNINSHEESLKEYATKVKENSCSYVDPTSGIVDMEKFKKEFDAFMAETFLIWYGKKDEEKAKILMQVIPLTELDYEKLKTPDPSLFGQYTINPETVGISCFDKKLKIKIADMGEFVGKPRFEVIKAVIEQYGKDHHIPGLEYEKYLLENPEKIPEELKDGNWFYFMGSTLRARFGGSDIPYVSWDGEKLSRHARWLDGKWNWNDHVILFEK